MAIAVGAEYKTGEKAAVSGRYDFVRHNDSHVTCEPTPSEMSIPLTKGETFPPCRSCNSGVWWRLAEVL